MKSLTLLSIAQAVSSQFLWANPWIEHLGNPPVDEQHQPIVSDFLNDLNLDISLPPKTQPLPYENDNNDNIWNTGHSVFGNTFGRRPQAAFEGFHHSQPLYLTMYHPQNEDSSSFLLKKQHQINGDTWRYSLDSNDDNAPEMKTWSTHKLYICGSLVLYILRKFAVWHNTHTQNYRARRKME